MYEDIALFQYISLGIPFPRYFIQKEALECCVDKAQGIKTAK